MRARAHTRNRNPLNAFARDIAARLQRALPGRAVRVPPPAGRRLAGAAPGGSVNGIADRLLAMNLPNPMEAIEIALLSQAMNTAAGNITAASRILGIHRKAVERLVTKHKVKRVGRPRRRKVPTAATRTRRVKPRR